MQQFKTTQQRVLYKIATKDKAVDLLKNTANSAKEWITDPETLKDLGMGAVTAAGAYGLSGLLPNAKKHKLKRLFASLGIGGLTAWQGSNIRELGAEGIDKIKSLYNSAPEATNAEKEQPTPFPDYWHPEKEKDRIEAARPAMVEELVAQGTPQDIAEAQVDSVIAQAKANVSQYYVDYRAVPPIPPEVTLRNHERYEQENNESTEAARALLPVGTLWDQESPKHINKNKPGFFESLFLNAKAMFSSPEEVQ